MKHKIYLLLFAMTVAFTFSQPLSATPATLVEEEPKNLTKEQIARRMEEMRQRVDEIKAMDRSSLTKEERKALRVELREMNKEAKAMDQRGVYLSFGAIIIIILLLILIL